MGLAATRSAARARISRAGSSAQMWLTLFAS